MQDEGQRMFLKLYTDALHSGLMGALGAELWQTYSAIACYIDADGRAFPSQELLAYRLNISRTSVNRRIKRLLEFEWNGERIVTKEVIRDPKTKRVERTIYTLHDGAFRIF